MDVIDCTTFVIDYWCNNSVIGDHLRNNFDLMLNLECPTASDATHVAILDVNIYVLILNSWYNNYNCGFVENPYISWLILMHFSLIWYLLLIPINKKEK